MDGGVNRWCIFASRKSHPRMSTRGGVFREPRGYLPGPLLGNIWSRRTTRMNREFGRSIFLGHRDGSGNWPVAPRDLGVHRHARGDAESLRIARYQYSRISFGKRTPREVSRELSPAGASVVLGSYGFAAFSAFWVFHFWVFGVLSFEFSELCRRFWQFFEFGVSSFLLFALKK